MASCKRCTEKCNLYDDNKYVIGCDKDAKARAEKKAEYDKKNTKGIYLKLNKKTDSDIIATLETQDNKQGFIKALIRAYNAGAVKFPYNVIL